MKGKVLFDTNVFILFIVGLYNPAKIATVKHINLYDETYFKLLISCIDNDIRNIIVTPNIMSEVDNLINKFWWFKSLDFYHAIAKLITIVDEHYIESKFGIGHSFYWNLGMNDCLILETAKHCKLFVTEDSDLADHARSAGINVFDLKGLLNENIRNT